jgi:hypothetical protein
MFTALRSTSLTLAQFLRTNLTALLGGADVYLRTPGQADATPGVSLWLCRITRDETLLNTAQRRSGATTMRQTPLPLRLHYLITPNLGAIPGAAETEQAILGRILQLLYDAPQLRGTVLQDDFRNSSVELTVRLETLGSDELSRLFQALSTPMRLSIAYEVSVVYIDSEQDISMVPVEVIVPQAGVVVGAGSGAA